jgi:DNA-binding HxlR family transcriptional regulator
VFGDQWTLLVVRDIMLLGKRTYQDFLASNEGIATNVLADRLKRLQETGIVATRRDPADRRRTIYLLTERGIDLLPAIVEIAAWSSKHDPKSVATAEIVGQLRAGHREMAERLRAELGATRGPRKREPAGR